MGRRRKRQTFRQTDRQKLTKNRLLFINECWSFIELETGLRLKWHQYKAMFIKRFLNSKRDKKAIITQLVLPVVMVLFGLLLISAIPARENDPPRILKLSNLSVDGIYTKAFFADYRNLSSSDKTATFKVLNLLVWITITYNLGFLCIFCWVNGFYSSLSQSASSLFALFCFV